MTSNQFNKRSPDIRFRPFGAKFQRGCAHHARPNNSSQVEQVFEYMLDTAHKSSYTSMPNPFYSHRVVPRCEHIVKTVYGRTRWRPLSCRPHRHKLRWQLDGIMCRRLSCCFAAMTTMAHNDHPAYTCARSNAADSVLRWRRARIACQRAVLA